MTTRKIFASNLSDEIRKSNKTLAELSKETGISTGSLSQYQNDSAQASVTAIALLSSALNVSADYLLGLSDVRTKNESIQNAHNVTGLSEIAILALKKYRPQGPEKKNRDLMYKSKNPMLDLLSQLIADPKFFNVMRDFHYSINASKNTSIQQEPATKTNRRINSNKSLTLTGDEIPEHFAQSAVREFSRLIDRYGMEAKEDGKA